MGRPKRNIESEWIDIFCDWDIAEQERTLAFLTELHRQAKRQASKQYSDARRDIQAVGEAFDGVAK